MKTSSFILTALTTYAVTTIAAPYSTEQCASLSKRSDYPKINQPITDDEWTNLRAGGLSKREQAIDDSSDIFSSTDTAAALVPRDKVMNCGHRINGKGGSNGHGKWVPVADFETLARQFCDAYTSTTVAYKHEISDQYPATFSNGKAGNIVFAVYNTANKDGWPMHSPQCYESMIAPLGNHKKREVEARDSDSSHLSKRDNCWGTKHNDYEGGYYAVDGIGAFGSEMYPV